MRMGEEKNQLNEIEEYAREAKPTERGRVWEGAGNHILCRPYVCFNVYVE